MGSAVRIRGGRSLIWRDKKGNTKIIVFHYEWNISFSIITDRWFVKNVVASACIENVLINSVGYISGTSSKAFKIIRTIFLPQSKSGSAFPGVSESLKCIDCRRSGSEYRDLFEVAGAGVRTEACENANK